MKLLNAFSLSMVTYPALLRVEELSLADARRVAAFEGLESFVGHADACAVYSALLGVPVSMNRVSVGLASTETALVGQYHGPRLPEGATSLPEGATIKWLIVDVYQKYYVVYDNGSGFWELAGADEKPEAKPGEYVFSDLGLARQKAHELNQPNT